MMTTTKQCLLETADSCTYEKTATVTTCTWSSWNKAGQNSRIKWGGDQKIPLLAEKLLATDSFLKGKVSSVKGYSPWQAIHVLVDNPGIK